MDFASILNQIQSFNPTIEAYVPLTDRENFIEGQTIEINDNLKQQLKIVKGLGNVYNSLHELIESGKTTSKDVYDTMEVNVIVTKIAANLPKVGLQKEVPGLWAAFEEGITYENVNWVVDDELAERLKAQAAERIENLGATYDESNNIVDIAEDPSPHEPKTGTSIEKAQKDEADQVPEYLMETGDGPIKDEKDLEEVEAKNTEELFEALKEGDHTPADLAFIANFNKLNGASVAVNTSDTPKVQHVLDKSDAFSTIYNLEVPEDVIEYVRPENFEYFNNEDKALEHHKQIIIAQRRYKLGLPPQDMSPKSEKITEKERELLYAKSLTEQRALIEASAEQGVGINVFCYPIIHRYFGGKLVTTINFIDKYVNVTRLLQYAHAAGYSSAKTPKNVDSWLGTKMGKLLMTAGKDRFRNGLINPKNGKVYKTNIRMGYKIAKRTVYEKCTTLDSHKGTYLHPRIAAYVAMWVSPEFHEFFTHQFEEAIEEYYELKFIEENEEAVYTTPSLPTTHQVLMYRRKNHKKGLYEDGFVQMSAGQKSYIRALVKKGNIDILYWAQGVPDLKEFKDSLKKSVPYTRYGNSNLYSFGGETRVQEAIRVMDKLDTYPSHLDGIWQDNLIKLENLGTYDQENQKYHNEKKAEFQAKAYGIVPKVQKKKGYWLNKKQYVQILDDGSEMTWNMR